MKFLYLDEAIAVCEKPPRVLSTDEPGGMPELVRRAIGMPEADIRTVHRLDRVVSGLMVLARSPEAASALSRQIREQTFQKEYLAVLHGVPAEPVGTLRDLLLRDKVERKTYVVQASGKGVQEAVLDYRLLAICGPLSEVAITLRTGRTHQIRAQFASRDLPLVGDRKYSTREDPCEIALWSYRLTFVHPVTGQQLTFTVQPPDRAPWEKFHV